MRLNTRAFGIAAGLVAATITFGTTLAALAVPGEVTASPFLSGVLFGYSVSPAGAFIGALWAYAYGFLAGAAFAFAYNTAAAPQEPPPADREPAAGL